MLQAVSIAQPALASPRLDHYLNFTTKKNLSIEVTMSFALTHVKLQADQRYFMLVTRETGHRLTPYPCQPFQTPSLLPLHPLPRLPYFVHASSSLDVSE